MDLHLTATECHLLLLLIIIIISTDHLTQALLIAPNMTTPGVLLPKYWKSAVTAR